ncbi:MAG TPA: SAM-dependent methyltransferase [Bacteroidota bacterium]|nr:SAM-dependent methyltransferase [Bacteroidota bacterium]
MNQKSGMLFLLCEYLSKNGSPGAPSLKNILRSVYFRSAWYSNDHGELERMFHTLKDPWNFESSRYEQERLKLLLGEVERHSNGSILEVGCAEGVFSSMLSTVTRRVVGIDVSPTAVARARERCPGMTFMTTSLEAFEPEAKFDLVVCAETLYYIQDVREAINKLSSLGRRCIVSYIQREAGRLDAEIEKIPGVEIRRYEIGTAILGRGMVAATWETENAAAP